MTGEQRFWQLAAELQLADERVELGTIMNHRCLRVGKEFLALYDARRGGAVMKLPKERVAQLIADEVGEPFAPAGKVFKEWVLVPDAKRRRWPKLLKDASEWRAASNDAASVRTRNGPRSGPIDRASAKPRTKRRRRS